MAVIFPPEIFDTILDDVHALDEEAEYTWHRSRTLDSPRPAKDLYSCSLVCRSWVPRTRLHIFNAVYLFLADRPWAILFGALIAHPLCTFRAHVRRLHIPESLLRDPVKASWLDSLPSFLVPSFLRDLVKASWLDRVLPQLALLTNLDDLYLEEEWRAGMQTFGPQLKRLDMHCAEFEKVSCMTELVACCTNLEHLSLQSIFLDKDWDSPPKPGDIFVGTPPSRFLRSLALQDGIALTAEFLTWLCPGPGSIKIPTVALEGISAQNARHVSRFLRDVGPSITNLALGFSNSSFGSTDGQDAFCRVADLTTLTNLETLQFGLRAFHPGYFGQSAKHVPSILARLDCPSLKEIRFLVQMAKADDFKMIDWESIVPTVDSARFPTLEVLSFRSIKEDDLEETKVWLEEHVRRKFRRNVEIQCATSD